MESGSASLARPPAVVISFRFVPAPGAPGMSAGAWDALPAVEQVLRTGVRRVWRWRTGKERFTADAIAQTRLYALPDTVGSQPFSYRLVCRRVDLDQKSLPGLAAPDVVVEAFGQAAVFLVRVLADLAKSPPLAWGSLFRFTALVRRITVALGHGEQLELSLPDGVRCLLDRNTADRVWMTWRTETDARTAAPADDEPDELDSDDGQQPKLHSAKR